MLDFII